MHFPSFSCTTRVEKASQPRQSQDGGQITGMAWVPGVLSAAPGRNSNCRHPVYSVGNPTWRIIPVSNMWFIDMVSKFRNWGCSCSLPNGQFGRPFGGYCQLHTNWEDPPSINLNFPLTGVSIPTTRVL